MRRTMMFLIMCCFQAMGFGYHDSMTNGTVIAGISPLTTAFGSVRTTLVTEPACIFNNPALASLQHSSVQLSGSSISWIERVIEDDVHKTNRTLITYNTGTAAALFSRGNVVLGAGAAKVAEFGYDGFHYVYPDPEKDPVGIEILQVSGYQTEIMGSAAYRFNEQYSAGFSAGARIMDVYYDYHFNSLHYLWADSSAFWSRDHSQFAWHAGLSGVGEIFTGGVSYASETEHMEDIIAAGVSAYAEHLKHTTVGFEAELTSPFDGNHFLGKLFLSMPLTKKLNLMASASFDDQRVANRAGFGFGMGFQGSVGAFTIGGGILNRFKARRNSAFPDEVAPRIDDACTVINIGVTMDLTHTGI